MAFTLSAEDFTRLANNFYVGKGLDDQINRISVDAELMNYVLNNMENQKKYKVALCCICVNPHYWQFIKPLVEGAKRFFLPGHQTDFLLWSDIPNSLDNPIFENLEQTLTKIHLQNYSVVSEDHLARVREYAKDALKLAKESVNVQGVTLFPIEAEIWPMPTLMRYHLMLQQEEKLKEYDFVFYCDVDMMFVNVVGDEILGERLTAVQQPMYAVRREYIAPYEPNPLSASYIPRPGKLVLENGRPRFIPIYLAGGFQGGKTESWINAMKVMKKKIDSDLNKNYLPLWNDETVWNSYLYENPDDKDIILSPSYTYPDGMHKEYFIPLWGRDYVPKLVTLTKKFSFQEGGGEHIQKMIQETKPLQ